METIGTIQNGAGPGLRERKKTQVRQALISSALELFRERGFDQTSIDDIAARANVSRRTFFRYFATKDEVIFVDRRSALVSFRLLLAPHRPGEPLVVGVMRAWTFMAQYYTDNRVTLLPMQQMIQGHPLLRGRELDYDREWEQAMVDEIAKRNGVGHGAASRALVLGGAIMGVARAVFREWAHELGGVGDLVSSSRSALELLVPLLQPVE
jgi:AcrR family transcriptional regulator